MEGRDIARSGLRAGGGGGAAGGAARAQKSPARVVM